MKNKDNLVLRDQKEVKLKPQDFMMQFETDKTISKITIPGEEMPKVAEMFVHIFKQNSIKCELEIIQKDPMPKVDKKDIN